MIFCLLGIPLAGWLSIPASTYRVWPSLPILCTFSFSAPACVSQPQGPCPGHSFPACLTLCLCPLLPCPLYSQPAVEQPGKPPWEATGVAYHKGGSVEGGVFLKMIQTIAQPDHRLCIGQEKPSVLPSYIPSQMKILSFRGRPRGDSPPETAH